ncbi:GRIP and coiled coil domain containing protein [Echinococcus multilocularis]|uniref:GRIP and coiled coil domain containing protein n=1 Tax=Echinococcus multilocularis TaxID=6211 RepID=A0A068Y3F2_ECHMU|nr:GRIP and coiled coil domain containing protein [Echinococcus multilocularis]
MSTVSADECYSNVDSLEELRRICGERDATINKLKILLVRKNKTIASLEEEASYLKTANQMVDQQTRETTGEVAKLKSVLSRQQIDLEQSKMEVETLSKMSSDLQRSFAAVKQERDTFKSEVSRLMNDLVTANARTTELYAIASKCSPLPNNFLTHSHNQHAFILATFKNLAEADNKSNPDLSILHVLQSIQLEMDRLQGIKGVDSLVVSSPGELLPLLEGFSTYLKQCSPDRLRLSLRVHEDKIRSYFTDISRSHNEVTSLLKDFTQIFNSSVQLILSTVNKLDSHSPRRVKTDLLHKEFLVLKGDLDSIKDAMMLHMSSFVENTSALRKQITSALIGKSLPTHTHHSPTVDNVISHNFKFRSILSVVSSLQNDLKEVKTTVSQWLTSLQAQIHDIQHSHGKLISEISQRSPPPPPYSERINVPNSSTLEALLTDVWQLKDSLSGVRYSLTEEFLSLQKHMKGIELIRRKLMCQLHNKVTKLRSDATDIRREMHELVSFSNHQFTAITTYVHSIKNMRLKGFEEVQRQRFKDYDRLVRDKESEIGQLRETCDRLSDECDRFGAMREALRQLILTSATSVSLSGLSTEDATLVTDLSSHLNRSQATQLELVEQTQAIASLQSDLAAKTAALDAAVVRATEAETSAAESAAEASGLQEKLNLVKRLLVRVRKDASETKKRALRVVEMEAKVTELTQALDKSQRHEEAAQAKLAEVMEERERLVGKVASLQKQYESYKVKALLALRNGKEHPEEGNITGDSSSGTVTEGIKGGASTPLSWRYECSSMVQTEVVRLKERVRELEALLGQTTARLNSALIDLEAVNFALAEEREECSRVSHNLESERAQWREEQEKLNTQWRSETATRVAELTTALDAARQESIQALSTQAEEFNTAFGSKIAELQAQLDTAEAKVEAQRLELLEQAKIVQLTAQLPNSQTSQDHLCSRCGRCLSNGGSGGSGDFGDNVTSLRGHHTRPLEEALFGDDEMVSVDIQEAERQTSEMRKTVQSLRSQLANERRNLEYTKSLLVDSEAMVERLSAQATILKAEIRRHERNAERERHLGDHNTNSDDTSNSLGAAPAGETRTEYLKNVLLRFLCADPSLGSGGAGGASERNALVPVLSTLLALSPMERAALQQVAEKGLLRTSTVTAEDGASGEEGSSWSSFLPSWLGG